MGTGQIRMFDHARLRARARACLLVCIIMFFFAYLFLCFVGVCFFALWPGFDLVGCYVGIMAFRPWLPFILVFFAFELGVVMVLVPITSMFRNAPDVFS